MGGSDNLILKLYQRDQTVFSISEVALISGGLKRENLKARMNYYAGKGFLKNVRKGIYTKPDYNPMELATKIYTPSYISLETVLEKDGVIFQDYKTIFLVSYLTRRIEVDGQEFEYRRIKEEILLNDGGIIEEGNYAKASAERAFLDCLYLYKNYDFDNIDVLDKKKVLAFLPIYRSKKLGQKLKKFLR